MEKKKELFFECALHGRKFHDADEVWDELRVGTSLRLERDRDNKHDPNAVAVWYDRKDDGESFIIGYVPRACNDDLAKFFDMGWENAFACRISRKDEDLHYEEQVRMTIWIVKNVKKDLSKEQELLDNIKRTRDIDCSEDDVLTIRKAIVYNLNNNNYALSNQVMNEIVRIIDEALGRKNDECAKPVNWDVLLFDCEMRIMEELNRLKKN